ncbi:hypothetical protein A1507_09745 [Methylomonas koyamae]|uniref:ATPase AAA-type core domain-containing protein n=2 Tax=Methylomonas koyamae TaxID=702114 RepID=A0A177NJL1_9GAMM|nr:hypothetical protein A1507_09745 [Methylomonas koyamae]
MTWDNWRRSSADKQQASKIGQSNLSDYAKGILESFKTASPNLLPVFGYYGALRGAIEIPERLRPSNQNYNFPTAALVGALNSQSDFKEILKWFDFEESAELRANKGCRPDEFDLSIALETVRNAIENIFNNKYRNAYFNKDHKFVIEQENGMPLQISQLSQGYQSMLALVMDFARRLAIGNTHLEFNDEIVNYLHSIEQEFDFKIGDFPDGFRSPCLLSPGVMLIDEIDLHLHPSWQQRVIADLIRTFPNTQFIATTHSPQVLTTIPDECIRILKDGKIFAAPKGTEGAEASRMLKRVLSVDTRPQDNIVTKELNEYLDLVYADKWDQPRAIELREKLDTRYQGEEPALTEADLYIENRKWELEIETEQ